MSQINKNVESLTQFYNYKKFLDQLAPKDEIQEYMKKKELRRQEREKERKAKAQHEHEIAAARGRVGNKKKQMVSKTDQQEEDQIPQALKELIDESDDEYPLFFETSEELMEIFTNLEEKNLNLIMQS